MVNCLLFINFIFWLCFFSFLLAPTSFFFLVLLSEVVWMFLYALSSLVGSIVDDVTCFSISFFILGLASVELCFGLLLLVVVKQLRLNINLNQNIKKNGFKTFEKLVGQSRFKPKI